MAKVDDWGRVLEGGGWHMEGSGWAIGVIIILLLMVCYMIYCWLSSKGEEDINAKNILP